MAGLDAIGMGAKAPVQPRTIIGGGASQAVQPALRAGEEVEIMVRARKVEGGYLVSQSGWGPNGALPPKEEFSTTAPSIAVGGLTPAT